MVEKKVSLELFSGFGHFSQLMANRGFDAWSVDNNPRLSPRLCADILTLDLKSLPGVCHFLWASPDCRFLSRLAPTYHWLKRTVSYRNYEYQPLTESAKIATALVARTFSIIVHYSPDIWFVENPVGRFHHLESTRSVGHYRYAVNYYDWGFNYSKETYIFTNQLLPLSTKKIIRNVASVTSVNNRQLRSAIPKKLLSFLIDYSLKNYANL